MSRPESHEDNPLETIVSPDGHRASINPHGAYVESFGIIGEAQLLYSLVKTKVSARGGSFACAPVFGRGERVGLPQHGFARHLDWKVRKSNDPGSAEFYYHVSSQESNPELWSYAGCLMILSVNVSSSGSDQATLQMGLQVENRSLKPLVITPGFHHYLPVGDGENAKDIAFTITEGEDKAALHQFTARQLSKSQVLGSLVEGWMGQFSSNGYDIQIDAEGLNCPVIWTDNPHSYVCFEPTAAGPVTAEGREDSLAPYKLESGEHREYLTGISWKKRTQGSLSPLQGAAAMALQAPHDEVLLLI